MTVQDIIIGEFKNVGANSINVEFVCKKWNHLWHISQWKEQYTLIKMKRKDSDIRSLKTEITAADAHIIIKTLNLTNTKSGVFSSSSIWEKP